MPDSAADSPPGVTGGPVGALAGPSTTGAPATVCVATAGIFHSASRWGSSLATAAPAASVNTISRARHTRATRPSRLVTRPPFARC